MLTRGELCSAAMKEAKLWSPSDRGFEGRRNKSSDLKNLQMTPCRLQLPASNQGNDLLFL